MKLFSILLFLSIALKGYAQSDLTFYYNKEGAEVKQKSEAAFIRTVLKQTDGTFLIKEFNGKDTLLLEGAASTYPPISFQGMVKRYYENGKLKEKVNYEKNRPKGLAQFYYANGQLKKTLEYYTETSADSSLITPLLKFQMVSFYDSLGVQLVKNGNGFAVEKSPEWINKGKYVNGFKDSIWMGEGLNDIRSYRETYVKGELKSGVSVE